MKSRDFFRAENDRIYFLQSGKAYALHDLIRTEVLIRPVLKTVGASIANAIANAMTNSLANGNEQVHIIVRIHLKGLCGYPYESTGAHKRKSGLSRNGGACP